MIGNPVPVLMLVSGPSGTGKSTLCRELLSEPNLVYSISCTTRPPRGEEVDGEHYHFMDEETFQAHVAAGNFLEHAKVYDNYYGTLASNVTDALENGNDVLLEIDVKGAGTLRRALSKYPAHSAIRQGFVDVFIGPPSLSELRERLEARAEDAPDVIELRMKNAERELREWKKYNYVILNHLVDDSVESLRAIYRAARHRVHYIFG